MEVEHVATRLVQDLRAVVDKLLVEEYKHRLSDGELLLPPCSA